KLDLNKLKIVTGPVPLFQLLNNISTFFVNECAKKGISFFFDLSDNVPDRIIFDDLRLKQILNNLLSNALKFTKKGHIKMSVWCTTSHEEKNRINLNFKIEDTGIGMKPSGVEKLFKSFEQVHEEGSVEERGSGLGLYISKKLIDQMNGSIDVKSIFSIGTSFKVSFKNIEPVAVVGDTSIEDSFHYNFFGKTVLIADDLDINLKLLEAYISDSNLKVEKAKNGQELIEKSVEHEPALIITDIKMPTMDGYLAAKKLNSIKKTKDIPIIALTAAPDKEGIRGDFKSFLQKPVNKSELLIEISKYIECEKINKQSGKKESFVPTIELYESKTPFKLNTGSLKTSDLAFLKKLLKFCEETLDLMEINAIEDGCQEFQKEISDTNFSELSIWFSALENDTKLFKIDEIEEKVKSGMPIIKETIESINKKP
ncbi:ATP-binding protein, partial [Bacteriovoracales bacterium]|nr:ATP-binding protein [Bacteriovoracales bacterium]